MKYNLRYDGMVYGKIDPALHDHKNSRLAHYFGNPFVVGGTENTKTEVYDFDYETWVELPPFPFATFIHSYGLGFQTILTSCDIETATHDIVTLKLLLIVQLLSVIPSTL